MNFAIKVRAEQVYLLCRAVAKSRHYEVLPQRCGALRARLKCHSERSEESRGKYELSTALQTLRSFATLRMTARLRQKSKTFVSEFKEFREFSEFSEFSEFKEFSVSLDTISLISLISLNSLNSLNVIS